MNSRQKSIYHFFLILFLLVGTFNPLSAQQKTGLLSVSKVVDGDTFWLINARGEEEKIRLIGVDSPEARNAGRVKKEYFGAESSAFAKRMLDGKRVRLEYDVQRKDRYQRTLAYVYLEDGTFFNALLVREGYATVATFPPNVKYEKLFIRLQREARSQRKGLWK